MPPIAPGNRNTHYNKCISVNTFGGKVTVIDKQPGTMLHTIYFEEYSSVEATLRYLRDVASSIPGFVNAANAVADRLTPTVRLPCNVSRVLKIEADASLEPLKSWAMLEQELLRKFAHLRGDYSLIQLRTPAQREAYEALPHSSTPQRNEADTINVYADWHDNRLEWPRRRDRIGCSFGCDLSDVNYRSMADGGSNPCFGAGKLINCREGSPAQALQQDGAR